MTDGSNEPATEISIGVNVDGKEVLIPSLVPGLNQQEIDHLLSGQKPTPTIVRKAVEHYKKRKQQGLGAFK
jgi:ribosomal protein L5